MRVRLLYHITVTWCALCMHSKATQATGEKGNLCRHVGPALGDLHTEVHKSLIAWLMGHACRPGTQHVSHRPWGRQLQARFAK